MDKKEASEVFDTSVKNTKAFTFISPEGREVKGFISKSRRFTLGSLIITEVDGAESGQYVQGMPKIQYLDQMTPLSVPNICHKLDGSNITLYPLIMNGEVLEVLAKSRGMPICASNLYDLTLEKMTENHLKLVENERLSATFELYGSKNPNDIPYHRFGVDLEMDLLNILDQGMSFPCEFSFELAKQYGIPHDFEHFNVIDGGNVFKLKPTDEFIEKFGEYTDIGTFYADDYLEIYNRLEVVYEEINNNWRTQNKLGHTKEIIMEGSVWHMDNNGTNVMVKNKATSVREGHIAQACGIPHHAISKALFKAKDEMNIFDEDKLVVIAFVKEELSEEFEKDMIEDIKTEQKILSLLKKRQQKLIIDGQLQEILDNVHDHVGEDANPTDKMRKFAELYPDLTKMSKKVYQAFTNQHLVE